MSQVLDEKIFHSLREIAAAVNETDWMQSAMKIAASEHRRFLDNEVENPLFKYKAESTFTAPISFAAFQKELDTSNLPDVVLHLYQRKFEHQRVRNQMNKCSLAGDDECFFESSAKLYGRPKKKYFSYVCKRVNKLCRESEEFVPRNAKRLRRVISRVDTSLLDVEPDMLPSPVEDSPVLYSMQQVVQILTDTLHRYSIDGWTLEVDQTGTRSRFSVNAFKRVVNIPHESKLFNRPRKLTLIEMEGIAEHEIGIHVRRSHGASKHQLRLLEIGLDSYIRGEEGLAGFAQQQVQGGTEFYGFDRYLAACLATGMDGEKRDFRSVFSLMVDYYTVVYVLQGEDTKNAPLRAAWDVCVRIFRGTTGQTAGCIYTKDIVYLEGNIKMWLFMTDHPERYDSLFVGKFNPFLSRHVRALQSLGILKEW